MNKKTSLPRLLFVNQHYHPDVASTGQHLTDLAEHLAGKGFDVSVLCGRTHYQSGTLDAPRRETLNGVSVRRVTMTSFGRSSHLGRLLDYLTFLFQALFFLVRRRFDYVVFLTTPPLLCVLGWLMKHIKGQKYGIWSMDLHPDAEQAIGMIGENSLLSRLLHGLNDTGYRGAEFVVALGSVMRGRILEKGVDPDRLHVIPVWNRRENIRPIPPADNPMRQRLGLTDPFVVMYSGNAGLAHRFEDLLRAIQKLEDREDIFFLFVGGGPRRAEIERFAREHALDNVSYRDYVPRDRLSESLSTGDLHLLTLRRSMAGIAVPGKLYGIMAAGRPCLMVGPRESEPGRTIRENEIGRVVEPNESTEQNAGKIVDAIEWIKAHPDERRRMGERARSRFLAQYERQPVCDQWSTMLKERKTG